MPDDDFLFKELAGARKYGGLQPMPEYIEANLNPSRPLRDYQREAFENFVTHFESANRPKPTQVLFHMATGSGKTLIMAGLIVYLYARGYRNFLFFVNLTNILDKTRDNFAEPTSGKYLFAKELNIGGRRVRVNVTDNFQYADPDAINLCFTTTQGLHIAMNFVKENGMTADDFREREVVLISDEAHHLNVGTRLNATEQESKLNWEDTVERIFEMNSANVLLEFTATCNLANPAIRDKYEDKIVFDYPLKNFYAERYSKEIITFRTAAQDDRVLTALVMSQYRLKLFQDNGKYVKPVVLFKSAKIQDSKDFQKNFVERMKNLRGSDLQSLSERVKDDVLNRAFAYFAGKGITFDLLADELRAGFSEEHCISANDKNDDKNQIVLNSLEDADNPYRAVFEVKKLDEGWDVLNLFDIVRLYETRRRGDTIAEAQLIGRGARYCPFKLNDAQPEYQRKFDGDTGNELRVCETLYYHCQHDRRYINELHDALRELGLPVATGVEREYKLTEPFKSDKLYTSGVIFLNEREEVRQIFRKVIPEKLYTFERIGGGGRDTVMGEHVESVERTVKLYTRRRTFGEIAAKNYAIVHKALRQYPPFAFDRLRERFDGLKSTRQFITDAEYLGDVAIDITSNEREPGVATLYAAAFDVLGKIAVALKKSVVTYKGTTNFREKSIKDIFHDKTVRYPDTVAGGLGDKQHDLNLADADWFAYNDNYGTNEEKAFVEYFSGRVDALKQHYSKVYLVRNERLFGIYAFDDGERFEPDFVLFLERGDDNATEQFQIFIEPKGTHLLEHDAWKQKFLLQLQAAAVPVKIFVDDTRYRIWGLPFYNADKLADFDKAFGALLNS